MKKNKRNFIFAVLLAGFLCVPANPIRAASNKAEVSLTIKQSFELKNSEKDGNFTGNYELRALDKNIPMPEGRKEDSYFFSLSGKQVETTVSLAYEQAGVYCYQLLQVTGDRELYQYDRSCYDITVYVEKSKDGKFVSQVTAEKGDGKKYGELEFQNCYYGKNQESPKQPESLKPVKTGDTANITMYIIMAAGAVVLIAVLVIIKRYNQKKNSV